MSMVSEAWKSSYGMTRLATCPSSSTFSSARPKLVTYTVGDQVYYQAGSSENVGLTFSVEPALPPGLTLDPRTGCIQGEPTTPCKDTTYTVVARRTMEFRIQVEPPPQPVQPEPEEDSMMRIDSVFAQRLDQVTDLGDLHSILPESRRMKGHGDWMLWMVHRAKLDDPTLKELNFDNMYMPPEHVETRIAPTCEGDGDNTHMEVLSLNGSNLQKKQGNELAESLKRNTALRTLNLESNSLDSESVCNIALALRENSGCKVEALRVQHQRQVPKFFGRPTEEAMGRLMQENKSIVKLSFACADSHWRDTIDRALLRNNDNARARKQQQGNTLLGAPLPCEEKTLTQVVLSGSPPASACQVVPETDDELTTYLYAYMWQTKTLPTAEQFKEFAQKYTYERNGGLKITYSTIKPLITQTRHMLLEASVKSVVDAKDPFGQKTGGVLTKWSQTSDTWQLELNGEANKRYVFRCKQEPKFEISHAWADFLRLRCKIANESGN
eukprot:CAMPEP_0178415350 /NCGR_PEP_ID=MMETSP0689_2-20121128/23506_1 /TAXON_ID=160604 /ORGANISM="Amphidinium massartii, Strain CS-259" /LENGTH=496 /DNA_ID=CAMNT_0020036667 /DNA_START=75 /DNA_END=1566 /DNA_ORIENTATION=-